MKTYLQRMGRSLQLPIAILPAAALLQGLGHWLPTTWPLAKFLKTGQPHVEQPTAAVDVQAKVAKTESVMSVVAGKQVPLEQVADPTFAQKMLGDGYAIEPADGHFVAPLTGEVTALFPTYHAVGLTTASGLEILIHIGIDTVALKGVPFKPLVKVGQMVMAGTPLITADLTAIRAAGKSTTTMVIVTNMNQVAHMSTMMYERSVHPADQMMTITPYQSHHEV